MTDAERDKLAYAFDELFQLAERECDGYAEPGEQHDCGCETCIARRARAKIEEAIDPAHVSLQENRLTSPPERVYLEKWRKDNERQRGINSGFTLLEHILCPSGEKRPPMVSHRDAQVAASVIQWLGTNCGNCFLRGCEQKIMELDRNYRGIRPIEMWSKNNEEYRGIVIEGYYEEAAGYVAGQFFPFTNPRYEPLKRAILRCIRATEKRAKIACEVQGAGI